MNSTVEEIKQRLNIVDLVGEYVRLQKAGANWRALCPFHHEKSPSFMVSDEKQIWHCFGCQKGGDIFGFVMEIEGMEFREALGLLADKAGVKLQQYNPVHQENKKKTESVLELATKFYEKQLWDGIGKDKILKYLRERGLNDDSIRQFRLGYAPSGWRNALTFLLGRKYAIQEIEKSGLLVRKNSNQIQTKNYPLSQSSSEASKLQTEYYDRFRDRIMFPIQDALGHVIGFSARVAPGGDESQAKYVNTPETEVYRKSRVLYGIDKAKREIKSNNVALVVEGNMDVIACHQAGFRNTVAVSGTALTEDHIKIVKRYAEQVKLFFDMDAAGKAATAKSAQMCFQNDVNVSVVVLPSGKDAAEIAKTDPKALADAIEKSVPAMEYFFHDVFSRHDLLKAEDKKKIAKDLLVFIRCLANTIEKSHWIKRLAEGLEVEEKMLYDVIRSEEKKNQQNSVPARQPDFFYVTKRSETLEEKVIGVMLANSDVWKRVCEERKKGNKSVLNLENNALFLILVEKGFEAGYRADAVLLCVDDDKMREKLRTLHFNARYHFNFQEGAIDQAGDISWSLVEKYLNEIIVERLKEKMEGISRDVREEERKGNKTAVAALVREFNEISKQLTELKK